MKMKKNILIIGIVLLIALQINFIISQEIFLPGQEIPETEGVDILSQGDVKWEVSEDGKEATIFFTEKSIFEAETFVEIKGNKYENILSADKSLNPSFIRMDDEGKIIEADLTTNEKGGTYVINGVNFKLPANSRVYYKNGILNLPKNSKVMNFDLSYQVPKVKGAEINLFDETSLNGEASFQREGYLIEKGEANYKQLKLTVDKDSGNILIAKDPSTDLSNYKGNWIKQTTNRLEMKSSETGTINLKFLENHEIIRTGKAGKLNGKITNGDGLVFERREGGLPPLAIHESSENGKTFISNGDLEIEFNKEAVYLGNEHIGLGNVEMEIKSDSENIDSTLRINNKGELSMLKSLAPEEVRLFLKEGIPISKSFEARKDINAPEIKEGESIYIVPLTRIDSNKLKTSEKNYPEVYTMDDLPVSAKIISVFDSRVQDGLDILNELEWHYDQREEGKMTREEVQFKERIAESMSPNVYDSYLSKVGEIKKGEIKESSKELRKTAKAFQIREDLFRVYLGLPQKNKDIQFTGRKVVPTKEKDTKSQYYGFDTKEIIKSFKTDIFSYKPTSFNELAEHVKENNKIWSNPYTNNLGKYIVGFGFDEERREKYISYYDVWDINPPELVDMGVDVDKYNFPFEIYGRIYESDFEGTK